jgi:hypothetical protein
MAFLGMNLSEYGYAIGSPAHRFLAYDDLYYSGEANIILPTSEKTHFHSILAVDKDNNIIRNSNSFLVDLNFIHRKDNYRDIGSYDTVAGTNVFRRINATYHYLTTHPVEEIVEREMFLLVNPFSSTNIGHDLSILFDRIQEYNSRQLTMPVVLAEAMLDCPRSLEICQLLLPNTEIYYLPSNKIIHFKNLHISKNVIFDITRHKAIIDKIIDKVISNPLFHSTDKFKNKKIILIKSNHNKYVVTKSTCYNAVKFIDTLVNNYGWMHINPEEMSMIEIIAYLYYADKILTSFGAISYAHTIFFNPNKKYYYLQSQYAPYYYHHNAIIIHTSYDLDANISKLVSKIEE